MDLIIDLGQSGARISTNGSILSLPIAKKSTSSVLETLENIFKQIPKAEYGAVHLSLTGLRGFVGDTKPYGELCKSFFSAEKVAVMDDGFAAYVGALGSRNGVALTLGGGVVAVAGRNGKFGHADGKGRIFGDLGGGFWIGQMGLRGAIATLDGRDSADDLVELLNEEIKSYGQLPGKSGEEAAELCIAAAKTVAVGADRGVESAIAIINEGAVHVAKTVRAAWMKVNSDLPEVPTVAVMGGLSKSAHYMERIKLEIEKSFPCKFIEPDGDQLLGAVRAGQFYPNGVEPLFKLWQS